MNTQVVIDLVLAGVAIVGIVVIARASVAARAVIETIFKSPKTRTFIQRESAHVVNILDETGSIIKTLRQ